MNTLATYLPSTIAKQSSKVRVWAFAAAVRLSDQDKPIALKLIVELAIVIRMLAQLAHNAHCAAGKSVVACRARRPLARVSVRGVRAAKRTAVVNVRRRRPGRNLLTGRCSLTPAHRGKEQFAAGNSF